jgi:protein MAK11
MSIVAGSYDKFIWGFRLKTLKHSEETLNLVPLFSFPSHRAPIKTVAVCGSAAVSGGSDDTIKVYDFSTCFEMGSLIQSTTVTTVAFFTPPTISFPRNLISAGDDGTVSIFDCDPFVHLQSLTVHKKGVNDLAIHPSGKLALTVGRDSCLAMVNLIRGRRSFYCRLGKEATTVEFNSDGDKFFMAMDEKVSVHESNDARLLLELDNHKRVACVASGMNGVLFTGGEDRNVTAWDTNSGKIAYCVEDAHSARVKGIVVLSKNDGTTDDDPYLVSSASSDGVIRVWDLRMSKKDNKPTPLAEANTKSRLTCLAGSSV